MVNKQNAKVIGAVVLLIQHDQAHTSCLAMIAILISAS